MQYKWKAVYSDGTFLEEYREDGTPNKYHDIDRTKLEEFWLYKDDKPVFRLVLEPTQTLIYRLRGRIRSDGLRTNFYMIGWKENVNGKSIQCINYVPVDFDAPITSAGKWDGGEPDLTEKERESVGQ